MQADFHPKYDNQGKVIPWSIVGPVELFEKSSITTSPQTKEKRVDFLGSGPSLYKKSTNKLRGSTKEKEGLGLLKKANAKSIQIGDELIEEKFLGIAARQKEEENFGSRNLKKRKLIERLKDTKDERILENYTRMKKVWDRQNKVVCERLNRSLEHNVVTRAEGYREKMEKVTALELATPSDLKYGDRNWYLSLRKSDYVKDIRHHTINIGDSLSGTKFFLMRFGVFLIFGFFRAVDASYG